MKDVFLYDTATGRIIQHASGPDAAIDAMTGPTVGAVPFEFGTSDASHFVDTATDALVPFPARPASDAPNKLTFDYVQRVWFDSRSLAQRQTDRWATIKAARDAAINADFTFNARVYQGDERSQMKITQYAMMALAASGVFNVDWVLADNSTVTLTKAQILGLAQAMVTKVQLAYTHSQTLRTAIFTANTPQAVDAVTW